VLFRPCACLPYRGSEANILAGLCYVSWSGRSDVTHVIRASLETVPCSCFARGSASLHPSGTYAFDSCVSRLTSFKDRTRHASTFVVQRKIRNQKVLSFLLRDHLVAEAPRPVQHIVCSPSLPLDLPCRPKVWVCCAAEMISVLHPCL
jgi:hypothetical protein